MLTDFMDFDPRITSDGHGWCCNFHMGYGHDIILEDATNEISCVQALQCLIAKADTEIHELENELAILECQLKLAKSNDREHPYEFCYDILKSNVDESIVDEHQIKNVGNKRISDEHDFINIPTKQNSPVLEKQLLDTVSEESCSGVAKHGIKTSFDARGFGETDIEENNNKGNTKSNAFHQEETEACSIESKDSVSASSPNCMMISTKQVNISKEDDLYAQQNLGLLSYDELVLCLESPRSGEGEILPLNLSTENPDKSLNKSSKLDIVETKELDHKAYDVESLKLKFSQEPDFLHKMKVPELKSIAKFNKIKGVSKLKKEKIIEELTKLLNGK